MLTIFFLNFIAEKQALMFPWSLFFFFCPVAKLKAETTEPVPGWPRFGTLDHLDREASRWKNGGVFLIVFFKDGIE